MASMAGSSAAIPTAATNFKAARCCTTPGSTFGTYGGTQTTSAPKMSANGYELGGRSALEPAPGELVAGVKRPVVVGRRRRAEHLRPAVARLGPVHHTA